MSEPTGSTPRPAETSSTPRPAADQSAPAASIQPEIAASPDASATTAAASAATPRADATPRATASEAAPTSELETLRQRCRALELQVADAAQTNTAFINNMKTSDTKQVVMYEEQLKKLREELEAAFKVTKDQKEAHDREMGVLKAQLEESIQAKDGDHSAKLNLTRATAAEAKVSQLQHQLLSLQSQNEELITFKKATEFGIRESPAFATEVGKFFAEMDSLRASVQSEREAREAALAAWEAAEARAHRLLEQQADQKTELHRDLKVAMEEKRVLEKNVEWQMEQNRRDEARLRMVEAELRGRTEEATSMRIKLAGFQTEVRAAMEMEQIKAQVMIESLKSEIEQRERSMQQQIDQLQMNLDREMMQKLQLEKALKKSELTFQDQLREREKYWREQQLQVQQAQQRAHLELPLPADVGGVGAKVRSARQREIAEIEERITGLQHEQHEHEARKQTRTQTEGMDAASRHPLTSKLAQLGNDLFKRSLFTMPAPTPRGPSSSGAPQEWSMQPPLQQYVQQPYQQSMQQQQAYHTMAPAQHMHHQGHQQPAQHAYPSQHQQQQHQAPYHTPQHAASQPHMTPAALKQKSPSNRPFKGDITIHDDHAWEQEFWNADPGSMNAPVDGTGGPRGFMLTPPPQARPQIPPKAASNPTSAKPPHFVAPIAGAAAKAPARGVISAPSAKDAKSRAAAKPPAGPPNAAPAKAGSRGVTGRK